MTLTRVPGPMIFDTTARINILDDSTPVGNVNNLNFIEGTGVTISLALVGDTVNATLASTGSASPLTTKGDLYTYSTVDARLGVGTNGHVLIADSAQTTGLRWGEVLVPDGDKGDITVSGTGTSWTIDANAVSNTKFRQSVGLSVIGRSANTTGDVADITAASDHQVFRRSGTAIGFGAIDLSQAAAVSNELSIANGGTGASLTDPGADRILFWDESANAVTWLTVGSGLSITSTTLTASGGNAGTVTVSDAAADTTTWVLLGTSQTGDLGPATDAGLTYNASTNALTTSTFVGALSGNASTATALQTARTIGGVSFNGTANIVPQTIQSNNEASDTTCFPLFITASGTQSLQPKNNTAFTFNSSTGALGATSFVGAGTGLTGTAASLTAGTVTTNANLTGDVTSVGNATSIAAGVIVNADINASAAIALTKLAATTANRALISDGSGFITVSDVTATEISYLDGVTSNIQTQIDSIGGGSAITTNINQTSHGFSVGDILRLNGSSYVLAQADSAVNAEVTGIVSDVSGANDFSLTTSGYISGLSSLTAGATYFLSETTPGLLTETEPSGAGEISKPLLVADTTTSGYLFNMRGISISLGTEVGTRSHGQCYLIYDSPNIKLIPFNGRCIIIDDVMYTIPSSGVSLSPTGLTQDTDYYVYAYMNSGTMTLEASATGTSVDSTSGVTIKSGDSSRTLVGMVRPVAGPAFIDSLTKRFVISYFNRKHKPLQNKFSTTHATTNGAWHELHSEIRCEFLAFDDYAVSFFAGGSAGINATQIAGGAVGFNSTSALIGPYGYDQAFVANATVTFHGTVVATPNLGYNYATFLAISTGGATTTYNPATALHGYTNG